MVEVDKPGAMTNWLPPELLRLARDTSRGAFQHICDAQFFLVVVLDGHPEEFRAGLSSGEVAERDGIPFRTSPVVAHASSSSEAPWMADRVQTLLEFRSRRCFVARLKKRGGAGAFQSQVTVGRARNNDVVLRHSGVSKLHASFVAERGRLLLVDSGSRNHTFLNRTRVEGQVEVQLSDRVNFGPVETLLCDADTLWLAVHR